METLRVQVNFQSQRDAELGNTGGTVVAHMTGNEAFSDLAPDVGMVQAAHVAYIQSLAAGPNPGAMANAIKAECRKALETSLHDLGVKINLKAKGNQPMLTTTGYPLVAFKGRKGRKDVEVTVGVRSAALVFKA